MNEIFYTFTTVEDGNIAYHVRDNKINVDKNRKNLSIKYGFDLKNLFWMNQVHGNEVKIIDKNSSNLIDNCDAIITKDKDLILMVMVADCIPILMFDKKKGVVAAVHAGRNSTLQKIAEITAKKMIDELKCKAEDIEVIMGPSIQGCCYEVGNEIVNIVEKSFGKEFIIDNKYLNLQLLNKKILENIGVFNISISNICTKCTSDNFYSYRRDKNCGRFCALIAIK